METTGYCTRITCPICSNKHPSYIAAKDAARNGCPECGCSDINVSLVGNKIRIDLGSEGWLWLKSAIEDATDPITIGDDILDTFEIKSITPRCEGGGGGVWARGRIAHYIFDALVFPEHTECESFELGNSRISKLTVRLSAGNRVVSNFDRGWDIRPRDEMESCIVDLLTKVLADIVFSDQKKGSGCMIRMS